MTTPDPTLAARLAAKLKCATEDPSLVNLVRFINSCADAFEAGQLITTAEADARVEAAVLAEREACALWHDREASAVMNGLHCGSENSDYRAANRLHDFHAASAAAIRSRGVTG